MPEFEHQLPGSDDPEWVGLVLDVENRFEALNDALADLRSSVIRLSSYRPRTQVVQESPAAAEQAQEAAAALEDAVRAFEAAAAAEAELPQTPEAVEAVEPATNGVYAPVEETPAAPDDDAARREEVSRIVAESREQHHATAPPVDGSWAEPHDDSEVDSTSEGSWPMARQSAVPINPPQHAAPSHSAPADSADEPAVDADEQARRDEVARMVAEMRAGLGSAAETSDDALAGDGPATETAEIVAQAAEITDEDSGSAAEEDEEARREDVAATVARMRAEMAAGVTAEDEPESSEGPADDADVRDEVRRAVEAAKAEMASGWTKEGSSPGVDAGEKKFSFPDWQTTRVEPSGPPVIVIKDPEGRVELARVYETLSQVNCDENAALLNYTPHSVTVGLNLRAQVPTKEAMEKAVETVFGRKCRVESDGVRVSVDIGADKEDAA